MASKCGRNGDKAPDGDGEGGTVENKIRLERAVEEAMSASFNVDHQAECGKNDWNVVTEVAQIDGPPIAAGNFLVKVTISCSYCGLTLNAVDDGKVMPYLETVMYP